MLKDVPVTLVDEPWLHITIDQITDEIGARINGQERAELADALRDRLREIDPFEISVGSAMSYHSGVIMDLHPDDGLVSLHEAVRTTIRAVRGDRAVRYPWGVQHLTLAYATAESDSDEVQRRLRRVRPSHAPLTVDAVHLVDVTADTEAKAITWERVAAIPLGA